MNLPSASFRTLILFIDEILNLEELFFDDVNGASQICMLIVLSSLDVRH
jgi:hypothetical protein